MRTIITFIILTILVSFLIFLKITSEATIVSSKYIGVNACKGCHSVNNRGDQYDHWSNSSHAKATKILEDDKAINYARKNKLKTPIENSDCLKCHSTGYGEKPEFFLSSFNIKDGIQCEECHNPGSEYSHFSVMISKTRFASMGGIIGNKIKCTKCHSSDVNNQKIMKCPFQIKNFEVNKSLELIKHSLVK